MAAIKGFMAEEWGVNIQALAPKMKKYVLDAVADGDLIQRKGKFRKNRSKIFPYLDFYWTKFLQEKA